MIENQGKLLDGVRHALDEAFSENMGGSEVLAAICKACREFDSKLYLCATGTAGGAADDREWLYDVTCLDYDAEYFLRQTVLVAECEWGPEEEIYGDFEKLLVAQAAVRVMVPSASFMPCRYPLPALNHLVCLAHLVIQADLDPILFRGRPYECNAVVAQHVTWPKGRQRSSQASNVDLTRQVASCTYAVASSRFESRRVNDLF